MPTEYLATLEVKIPQLVNCVHCDGKFVYEMTVTGVGHDETGFLHGRADARKAAEEQAEESVQRQLNKSELCEAVPCATCFRYQPYMAPVAASERYNDYGEPVVVIGFLAAALVGV